MYSASQTHVALINLGHTFNKLQHTYQLTATGKQQTPHIHHMSWLLPKYVKSMATCANSNKYNQHFPQIKQSSMEVVVMSLSHFNLIWC